MTAGPYSIGSSHWPGLSKLIEECGEVMQVAGKLIATNGNPSHWDGTDLRLRLEEELADLVAAVAFVGQQNELDEERVLSRIDVKADLFDRWHVAQGGVLLD